jgi:hypothetical protein
MKQQVMPVQQVQYTQQYMPVQQNGNTPISITAPIQQNGTMSNGSIPMQMQNGMSNPPSDNVIRISLN